MYTTRGTVSDEVILTGDNFILPGKSSISILPARSETGIVFERPRSMGRSSLQVKLDSDSYFPYRNLLGARYMVVSEGSPSKGNIVAYVAEHLISAMWTSGITDAVVRLNSGPNIPCMGQGIENMYRLLFNSRDDLKTQLPVYEVNKNVLYYMGAGVYDGKKPFSYMGVSQVETDDNLLKMEIKESQFEDLPDFDQDSLVIEDVYSELENHLRARPLGRIATPFKRGLHRLGSKCSFFSGISDENYVNVRNLGMTTDEIANLMLEKYRVGANEHLAHTAYADFFGELHTVFPGIIRGKFEFANLNHFTRMEALNMLKSQDIIQRVE